MSEPEISRMSQDVVAVIGAGPAGLACARWLLGHGLTPMLFEAAEAPGGQWQAACPTSAVWPGMRTNTSRVLTAFSDLDHPEGTATYPTREEVQAYLERYAERFAIAPRIRLRTRVEGLERAEDGWLLRSCTTDGGGAEGRRGEIFARAIVATGRHTVPEIPAVPGLAGFTGAHGVAHTASYRGPDSYRGATMVVAGCSISALEIASDLALNRIRVASSYRRQRYVLPKLSAGLPTDHVMFNRAAALAAERLPPAALEAGLKEAVLRLGGNPEHYGAYRPDDSVFAAGIAQAQHFLPAVAEGRIAVKPWLREVAGRQVVFADGSRMEVDGLLFGTGYRLALPWLSPEIRAVLAPDGQGLDLHDHSFHPDLPGLAFAGLYDLVGPYFPVLELQARWIAYSFAGVQRAPTQQDMQDGLARSRAGRAGPAALPMHALAILFARNAGVEPSLDRWPALEQALLFGPLSPASFRLQGPDRQAAAAEHAHRAAAAFGGRADNRYAPPEQALRDLLLDRSGDRAA